MALSVTVRQIHQQQCLRVHTGAENFFTTIFVAFEFRAQFFGKRF
jgi:hypothetical protein